MEGVGMYHFRIILMLLVVILCWLRYKVRSIPMNSKYFLNLLCTMSGLLLILSFLNIPVSSSVTISFDTVAVGYLVMYTIKMLNDIGKLVFLMKENTYFYATISIGVIYGLCVILELRDLALFM